nr:TusE/DsrC/DsvC family sulfur relay protein [Candidatus Westeberhardia cardiocondylae]
MGSVHKIFMKSIKNVSVDSDGYLNNIFDWNKNIAIEIANCEGITLSEEHWKIINFFRSFYFHFNTLPSFRILVNKMLKEFENKKCNSCYLFYLFPGGPMKQAVKISGLPKQERCL